MLLYSNRSKRLVIIFWLFALSPLLAQSGAWMPQELAPDMSGHWLAGCGDNTVALTKQVSQYIYFYDLNTSEWSILKLSSQANIHDLVVKGCVALAFSDSLLIGYSGAVSRWDTLRFKGHPLDLNPSKGDVSYGAGDSLAYFVTTQFVYIFDALTGRWAAYPLNLPFSYRSGSGTFWSKGDYAAFIFSNDRHDWFYNLAYSLREHRFSELTDGGYLPGKEWKLNHGFILRQSEEGYPPYWYIGYSSFSNQFDILSINEDFFDHPYFSYAPGRVASRTTYLIAHEKRIGQTTQYRLYAFGFDTRHGHWVPLIWDYDMGTWQHETSWDLGAQFAVGSKKNLLNKKMIYFIYSGRSNRFEIISPGMHEFSGPLPGFGGTLFGRIDYANLWIYSTRTGNSRLIPYGSASEELKLSAYHENFGINAFWPKNNTATSRLVIYHEPKDSILNLVIPKERAVPNSASPYLYMRSTYGQNNEVFFYSGLVNNYQLVSFPDVVKPGNLHCKGLLAYAEGQNKFVIYDATANHCDSLLQTISIDPENSLGERIMIITMPSKKIAFVYSTITHQLQKYSFVQGLQGGKCGNYVAAFWQADSGNSYFAYNGFNGNLVELTAQGKAELSAPLVGERLILVVHDSMAYVFDPQVISGLVDQNNSLTAEQFRLFPNYPNPFNSTTTIRYELKNPAMVKLCVYSVTGQLIKRLFQGQKLTGNYLVQWDGTNERGQYVASGLYFYRLQVGKQTKMRKMILIR